MAEVHSSVVANDTFKSALVSGRNWTDAVQQLVDALLPLPDGCNLGFLYATADLAADYSSCVTFLRERTGIRHWCGTVALGILGNGNEHHMGQQEGFALSALVGRFPEDSFSFFEPSLKGEDLLAWDAVQWRKSHSPLLAVVHGDPRTAEMPDLLGQVAENTGCYLVGGLTSGEREFPQLADQVYSLVGGQITTEGGLSRPDHDGFSENLSRPSSAANTSTAVGGMGLSGLLFDHRVQVATGLSQSYSPLGEVHQITDAQQNVIMELDGRPALEILKQEVGELLAHDLSRVAGYIHVGLPVPGQDMGDYLVRNLQGIDPQRGWFAVGDMVEPGRNLHFVRRDPDTAKADLFRMVNEVKARMGQPAKAAFYVSCLARGPQLFGPAPHGEMALIRDVLGDVPLTGFYGAGEISNNRLYGYTGVLTLFA
ncbi:FIST signal transduction protein [Rhodovibrionaceae bacterium A322]